MHIYANVPAANCRNRWNNNELKLMLIPNLETWVILIVNKCTIISQQSNRTSIIHIISLTVNQKVRCTIILRVNLNYGHYSH